MENEKKSGKGLMYAVIVIIAIVVIFAIAGSSNQPNNNQTQSNQTSIETPTKSPQVATQAPAKVPVQAPTQSLQSQCEATAKKVLDSYTPNREAAFKTQLGSDTLVQFTHSDHYNQSMSKCIMSLHEQVLNTRYNLQADYYYLYKLDNSASAVIGELWYTTVGATQTISQCAVNTLPCSSTDAYASMTAPYLNN